MYLSFLLSGLVLISLDHSRTAPILVTSLTVSESSVSSIAHPPLILTLQQKAASLPFKNPDAGPTTHSIFPSTTEQVCAESFTFTTQVSSIGRLRKDRQGTDSKKSTESPVTHTTIWIEDQDSPVIAPFASCSRTYDIIECHVLRDHLEVSVSTTQDSEIEMVIKSQLSIYWSFNPQDMLFKLGVAEDTRGYVERNL